jgi:hypothetical protein
VAPLFRVQREIAVPCRRLRFRSLSKAAECGIAPAGFTFVRAARNAYLISLHVANLTIILQRMRWNRKQGLKEENLME